MSTTRMLSPSITVGLDLGDRYTQLCELDGQGQVVARVPLAVGQPAAAPCDLRQWGQRLAARGGRNAKKRAVVAVARKLATLLHRLWVSGALYQPVRAAA